LSAGIPMLKMSGAGNDFIVLDREAAAGLAGEPETWAQKICRRGVSVGADGVLIVEPLGEDRVRVLFHNPDGSAAFCGNGSRCAARFARLRRMAGDSMVLETLAGAVPATLSADRVRLELPGPEDRGPVTLALAGESLTGRWIVAGVPHFVVEVPSVADAPLARWGPAARRHSHFGAAGVNVDVVQRLAGERLAMRTWERGVEGETLACGSGAVAAGFVERIARDARRVEILPASGSTLDVAFPSPSIVSLGGDARIVFEGTIHPEALCDF